MIESPKEGGYAPESVASPRLFYPLGGNVPESRGKGSVANSKNAVFSRFWVGICQNGSFCIPYYYGFKTGRIGGDAPDYL